MKKILVFLGHSDKNSYSGHLADTYEREARAAGNEVERLNISDLNFDPILHMGYKVIQELIAETLTFRCTLHDASDIDELNDRGERL